jgi:hypothetical protein
MESASPRRHTLQAAVFKPEELSTCCGVRGTRLAMMVDQTRSKGRFHDDKAHGPVDEPAFKLGSCQALGFKDAPVLVGDGELENEFGQINSHGSSMHVGLLSFEHLIPTLLKTRVRISRKQTGESIPSLKADDGDGPAH